MKGFCQQCARIPLKAMVISNQALVFKRNRFQTSSRRRRSGMAACAMSGSMKSQHIATTRHCAVTDRKSLCVRTCTTRADLCDNVNADQNATLWATMLARKTTPRQHVRRAEHAHSWDQVILQMHPCRFLQQFRRLMRETRRTCLAQTQCFAETILVSCGQNLA